MVEFALVMPVFVLLLFGLLDFGRLFFIQTTLQNAVRQAGRFAVTGNHRPDPNNPGATLSRVDSIIQIAQQAAPGFDFSSIQVTSLGGGAGSAGGPGDTVTISLATNLRLLTPVIAGFFPNGSYPFTVNATFKNEPFSPNNTR